MGGSYEIIDYLGRGAMGFVYRAKHNILGREYALKTLGADQVSDTSWRRFQIEAQAIAKMSHPNVVGIHNFALHQSDGVAPIPFYVMDLLVGTNLGEKLQDHGSPPLSVLLSIFQQAAAGLGYAHSKGMIHRDVKPGNIVLLNTPDSMGATVKIVDFGIAKLTDSQYGAQKLTTAGEVFGSPLYMSPEQSMAQPLDPRTDIYSLGVTLFEALANEPPFIAGSAVEVMMMHQSAPVPIVNDTSEVGYPPEIQQILEKMLAKMPDDRYQSMEHVVADLAAVARGQEPTFGAHSVSNTGRFDPRSTGGDSIAAGRSTRMGETTLSGPLFNTSSSVGANNQLGNDSDESEEEPEEKSARTLKSLSIVLVAVAIIVPAVLFFVSRPPEWMVKNSFREANANKAVASSTNSVANSVSNKTSQGFASTNGTAVPEENTDNDDTNLGKMDADAGMSVFKSGGTDFSALESSDRKEFNSVINMSANHLGSFGGELKPPKGSQNETFKYSSLEVVNGVKVRRFKFPNDIIIGRFEAGGELAVEATGTIDLSLVPKYTFVPYRSIENYPQYMKRFRPGDVTRVALWPYLCRNKLVEATSYIPDLKYLNLCGNDDFKPAPVVSSLRRLRSLTSFKAKGIGVSGADLADAKCWHNLEKLDLSEVYSLGPLLKELQSSPDLKGMTLTKTKLTSHDYTLISRLTNLRGLNISGNKVSANDLIELSKLPQLQYLNLQGCGADKNALKELKRFKSLREVQVVSAGPNSKQERSTFSKEFTGILVH